MIKDPNKPEQRNQLIPKHEIGSMSVEAAQAAHAHEKQAVAYDDILGRKIIDKMNRDLNRPHIQIFEEVGDFKPEKEFDLKVEVLKFNDGFVDDDKLKDTNPKDAVGIKKAPMSCVSGPVMMEVGLGMMEGALKYGRHNYRVAGVRASVYYDATQRHLVDWWEGTDLDPDSGLSHVTKAITALVVLRDSMIRKNWNDDRPPRTPAGWMQEYNKQAEAILAKYPDPKPAYTELSTEKF